MTTGKTEKHRSPTNGAGATAAIEAVLGGGIGAVVGAVLPARKTIYRAP